MFDIKVVILYEKFSLIVISLSSELVYMCGCTSFSDSFVIRNSNRCKKHKNVIHKTVCYYKTRKEYFTFHGYFFHYFQCVFRIDQLFQKSWFIFYVSRVYVLKLYFADSRYAKSRHKWILRVPYCIWLQTEYNVTKRLIDF